MKKVREGYKKTLAGEIPEDWWYEELNKLVDKITDGTHKTPTYTESGIPFLRVTDIQKSEIDWSNVKYISQQEHLELIKRCNPEIGDILYSKNGTIGIPKIIDWDNEFSIFVSLCLIKMKKQNSYISNKYLEQFLKSDSCMRQIRLRAKQGTVTNLHLEEIRELIIPIPTIKEQEKIASILSTVDEQIDNVDALIEKNKELKKGLMQTLLTKGIGHTKFKKTEIGEIPEAWQNESLGDMVSFEGGTQPPKKYFSNECLDGMIRLIQIRDYKSDKFKIYVPKELCRRFCDKSDVMIGRYGPPIFQILRGLEGAYNVALIKATPINERLDREYLYYFLNNEKLFNLIDSLSQRTSGQTGIDMEVLKAYKIPIPPKKEQEKIVLILSQTDKRIENYENKKKKLEEVKKGLMQQLLTGKIRVI
ncbi:restriction endonuclease subunit S [Clostridium saudiense]|uniref:restriction endonuclease subunit S n=1 Tax=Clostridium saudiense TaxID=1414720 RepID=UPI0018AA2FFE